MTGDQIVEAATQGRLTARRAVARASGPSFYRETWELDGKRLTGPAVSAVSRAHQNRTVVSSWGGVFGPGTVPVTGG